LSIFAVDATRAGPNLAVPRKPGRCVSKEINVSNHRLSVEFKDSVLYPVLPNGWLSGSSYVYLHQGHRITRLEGGFFGTMVDYVVVAVEVEALCGGHRAFPALIVEDAEGKRHRFPYTDRVNNRLVARDNGDQATGSFLDNVWVCEWKGKNYG
jgi:hypothetical protein